MSPDTIEGAKTKAREYFAARGTLAPAAALGEGIAEAFESLEAFLDTVPAAAAARTAIAGEWTIHEIVDHLVETHRPGLDKLWCLLAGRRPPGEATSLNRVATIVPNLGSSRNAARVRIMRSRADENPWSSSPFGDRNRVWVMPNRTVFTARSSARSVRCRRTSPPRPALRS